ncbi:protein DpdH [Micromonospora chersina]|uniref:protein DpdH n=1 Tax=Micromonospora chersina TaxID=47854 RepID=UPI0033AEA0AD
MSWREPLPAACWNADAVFSIIPVEAETPSDSVFNATHSALPILRREKIDRHAGAVVDENALLDAVHQQPADYPVLPILGRSGAGKSHLVRWLRMNLELKPGTRLVFVPKHRTSLRGILELVLQHAPQARAAELRRRVDAAVDSLGNEQEARLRLRSELATLIETRGAQPGVHSSEEVELRQYLASSLPALLLDPWFRSSLLADNGAIARLVKEKLRGKDETNKDDAFGFTADDVRLSVDDVRHASREAQDIAGALASDDELPRLAAAMLNEQLSQAVSAVFGLGGDDLKNLLVELRLELAREGAELLLLIEDFSIFQGIQGGLIDAITLVPSADLAVCPMRVVMAVTTGYFTNHLPDTVKTRTFVAFDLDLPGGIDRQVDAAAFAAPYLNAVRVGAAALEAARRVGDDVPNACVECPVTDRCHSAFGAVDGVGIFPFNRESLVRAIRSKSGVDGGFVARDVLTRVLRPVLHRDRDAVAAGDFPTEFFAREFATGAEGLLDIEDEARLERSEDPPSTNERRKRLVRFWGSQGGAQNLAGTIHQAFNVPAVEGLTTERKVAKRPRLRSEDADIVNPAPAPEIPMLVAAVDRWIETGEIQQGVRNELRRIVHALVVERIDFDDGCWGRAAWTDPSRAMPAFPQTAIYLGESPKGAEGRLVGLTIQGGASRDARALRALAWYSKTGSWRLVPNGAALQRLAYEKLEEWSTSVSQRLLPDRESESPELVAVVYALDAGAQILGVPGAYRDDLVDRVAAIVDMGETGGKGGEAWPAFAPLVTSARTGGVAAAADREQLRNRLLRLASFSQGGKPLALDIPRITRALKQAEKFSGVSGDLTEEVKRHLAVLAAQLAKLDDLADSAQEALPDLDAIGADIREATAVVNDLLDRAASANLLPSGVSPAVVRQVGREIKDGDIAAVARVRQRLIDWTNLSQREKLRVLTTDWHAPASRVLAWSAAADHALIKIEAALVADVGGRLQPELERAGQRLDAALQRACSELDGLLAGDADVLA